jgi:PAS domain S-box-containing protein
MGARFRSFDDGVSLRELAQYLREGIYLMDADGRILDANPMFVDLMGAADLEALRGRTARDRSRSREQWAREMQELARDGAVREFTREIERVDGETRTVLDTCYARHDGEFTVYHGIVVDVSVMPHRERPLADDHTMRDALTGCYTRRILDALDVELSAAPERGCGMCVVRVEGLTAYNARHGSAAGDSALVRMGRFLMRHIRADEPVARTSADTFVVALRDSDAAATEIVARRIQLAALRTAPLPFLLGWANRLPSEPMSSILTRAEKSAVPVRVVERAFEVTRSSS